MPPNEPPAEPPAEPAGLATSSAVDVAAWIAAGHVSPVEVLDACLERIERVQSRLNCFTNVWDDEARRSARLAADAVAARRTLGPLHGVVVAIKETTPVTGHRLTLGSWTHDDVAERDAHVPAALRRAGAVLIGHTTSPEFAHAGQTDSPRWGTTRNPWNPALTPGGSSGGSGVAVATGCAYLAEGSDMGGSVRIPASWCGIVGLKPGIGRIPMDVLPGLYDCLSHHGPLARTVGDARAFLAAVQGPDECDPQSVTAPLDLTGRLDGDVRGMRFVLSVDHGSWAVHPEIAAAVRAAAEALAARGAVVHELATPEPLFTARDQDVWIRLWGVFMSAYFGHLLDAHVERMDPDVVSLIHLGKSMSATELKRLELDRTALWHRVRAALDGYDAMLCPTMAQPPLPAAKADGRPGPHADDGLVHAYDMTSVWNLAPSLPVLSVPCGVHAAPGYEGVPIGMQVVGHRWREDVVLRVGRAIELALPAVVARRPF